MYNQSDTIMTAKPTAKLLSKAAQQMGRKGGAAGTPAQNAARARNALLAGRTGRVCSKCGGLVQRTAMARHDGCGLWTWLKPAERTGGA